MLLIMANLRKLGDIDIKTIAITSANGRCVSVYPQMKALNIYSDIFTKWMTGEIVLKDAQNIQSLFPLVGNELISISFITPSLDIGLSKDFFIYKMSEKHKLGREDVYCLYFISFEGIASRNCRISKTFRGDSVTMLNEILGKSWMNSQKPLFGEIPKNRFTYCSNFWDGSKNIDYICNHSVSQNDSPTFLFYETNLGFHFNSLDTLMSDKNSVFFNFEISEYETQMKDKQSAQENTKRDYMQVQQVRYDNGFDFVDRVESGYYGGRVLTFDATTGVYVEKQVEIENKNKLNNNQATMEDFNPVSSMTLFVLKPKAFNNIDDSGDNSNSDYDVLRKGLFSRLKTQRISIKVFGRSDYMVGQKVSLKVGKSGQVHDNDIWDKFLSGNFLITAVKQSITSEDFYSFLELSKDSYQETVETN